MITNIEDATELACGLQALVYHSIGDYTQPCDGFCRQCPARRTPQSWSFRYSGDVPRFIRAAILAKLEGEGHGVNEKVLAELDKLMDRLVPEGDTENG